MALKSIVVLNTVLPASKGEISSDPQTLKMAVTVLLSHPSLTQGTRDGDTQENPLHQEARSKWRDPS